MDRQVAEALVHDLQSHATKLELLVREGDTQSIVEARDFLVHTQNLLVLLREKLQASADTYMTARDIGQAMKNYADNAKVQVCVHYSEDSYAYYTVKSVTDMMGSSPTEAVIDLGEFIAGQ